MTHGTHLRGLSRILVAGAATAALAAGALVVTTAASEAAPPPPPKMLTLSKSTGINYTGDTVTVSGSGYAPGTTLFLSLCDSKDPGIMMGKGCLQDPSQFPVNIDQVKTDSTGKFSKAFRVNGALRLSATDVRDCMSPTVSCIVASSNALVPGDMNSIGFSGPMGFAASISKPGRPHLDKLSAKKVLVTWTGAVSGPSAVSGYTVQQRVKRSHGWSAWKTAGKTGATRTWLRFKGKTGKKYQFRVQATSPVGTTTGKARSIRL